jgi:glc operon protein GlcG
MIQVKSFIVTAFILVMAVTSQAQVMEKKSLSLDGARKVIAAAEAEAKRLNAPGGVIAVVDDGGNLMALERLDGTFAAGANISIGKARTASAQNGSEAITYFDKNKVSAAFAKGMPLIEISNYKVHASRRTEPGMAEVHVKDTDIIYVLEGSATLVTGGTVVDGKTTAQDEIRGAEISGGQAQKITKGDVIIVPAGTPHWFKDVQGPVLYYVVKVS